MRRVSELHSDDRPLWLGGVGYLIDWDSFPTDVFFPVPGLPELEVNILGDVWCNRLKTILTPAPTEKGYLRISTISPIDGRKISVRVHRIVAKVFHDNPENKLEVNHIDTDKANNCAKNLEWSTRQENMDHAKTSGVMATGLRALSAALTAGEVREIRRLAGTMSFRSLARMFNADHRVIISAVLGNTYKDVDPGYSPPPDIMNRARSAAIANTLRGTTSGRAVLTADQIREIRTLFGVLSFGEISKKFNVHRDTIKRILDGVGYSDVDPEWAASPEFKEKARLVGYLNRKKR
jgi:hypothetical protein